MFQKQQAQASNVLTRSLECTEPVLRIHWTFSSASANL